MEQPPGSLTGVVGLLAGAAICAILFVAILGSLKTRAHHLAAGHSRPGGWSCDGVEAARVQANRRSPPRGPRFATPDVEWSQRDEISTREVRAFAQALRRFRAQAWEELGSEDRAQRAPPWSRRPSTASPSHVPWSRAGVFLSGGGDLPHQFGPVDCARSRGGHKEVTREQVSKMRPGRAWCAQ